MLDHFFIDHLGLDQPGGHAVDRDRAAGQLQRQRLGGADDAGLGRAVVGLAAVADQAGDRGQGDDAARLAPAHQRHHQRVQHVVEAVQVGVDDRIPILGRHRREGAIAGGGGIADHPVIRAVRFDVRFQRGTRGIAVADVEHEHPGLSAQRLDLGHHGLCFLDAAAAMHHHIEAVARATQRHGTADAPAGAGHQHGQIPCHASPLSR